MGPNRSGSDIANPLRNEEREFRPATRSRCDRSGKRLKARERGAGRQRAAWQTSGVRQLRAPGFPFESRRSVYQPTFGSPLRI